MTLARWRSLSETPLLVVSFIFLGAYSYQVLVRPVTWAHFLAEATMWAVWAMFTIDYFIRLGLAPDRKQWFLRHLPELLLVLLPMFRALRMLRLITLIATLQRGAERHLRGRSVTFVTWAAVLLVYVSALAMLDAERHAPGAQIDTFGEALWWAAVTITTVGYGDLIPVTDTGKIVAVVMMVAGIALFGFISATLASWLVEKMTEDKEAERHATAEQVAALHEEVRLLREVVHEMREMRRPSAVPSPDRETPRG